MARVRQEQRGILVAGSRPASPRAGRARRVRIAAECAGLENRYGG